MREVILLRTFGNEKQTLGTWSVTAPTGVSFLAKTLELGDHNNAQMISCIPAGEYDCVYTRSNSFSLAAKKDVFTYEIMNVPNRAGCRIHSANFYFQLRGCVALGDALKDLNGDQDLDVVHSGNTVEVFQKFMNFERFKLKIIKGY